MKEKIISLGRVKTVFLITLVSVVCSVLLYIPIGYFIDNKVQFTGIIISFIVPMIIAPLVSWHMVGLFIKIDKLKKEKLDMTIKLMEAEKIVSMGELIQNIAHQWRQPLSVISTIATGMKLEKEYNILTDEKFLENCDKINNHAQVLSATIDEFGEYLKEDSKQSTFILNHTIQTSLHLVDSVIKNNGITLVLDLEDNIELVGLEKELTQCLINIINNSMDALGTINLDQKLIFITAIQTDNNVVISIYDNAGGIKDNILPKIFEPYFTTKHQSSGTGLGLYVAYNLIVDSMNGTLDATNIEYQYNTHIYKGAKFTIIL